MIDHPLYVPDWLPGAADRLPRTSGFSDSPSRVPSCLHDSPNHSLCVSNRPFCVPDRPLGVKTIDYPLMHQTGSLMRLTSFLMCQTAQRSNR